jgi:hypothetical protein
MSPRIKLISLTLPLKLVNTPVRSCVVLYRVDSAVPVSPRAVLVGFGSVLGQIPRFRFVFLEHYWNAQRFQR